MTFLPTLRWSRSAAARRRGTRRGSDSTTPGPSRRGPGAARPRTARPPGWRESSRATGDRASTRGPRRGGSGAARRFLATSGTAGRRSEEHTSELQSLAYLVCRLLLEKKKKKKNR